MMKFPAFLATVALSTILPSPVSAATWYFLRYWTPDGSSLTSFTGMMVIPSLPRAGVYYLWPGLQPTDNTGVYQNVLDGRSGTWWIGSGWCCENPSLPWGDGFNTYEEEVVRFENVLKSEGWSSTLEKLGTADVVDNGFALDSKSFNQAIFAIELYDVPWDFGPLEFRNVVITATGTDTSWCTTTPENYSGSTRFSITGINATVSDDIVRCEMEKVVLEGPA